MAFFSPELKPMAVWENVLFGLHIMLDEWYWLLSDTLFQIKQKNLKTKLMQTNSQEQKESLETKILSLERSHTDFRNYQITRRSQDIM